MKNQCKSSYGLSIGDLVVMNPPDPGSAPGLVLSAPDNDGNIDILISGTKRKVGWTQVRPINKINGEKI